MSQEYDFHHDRAGHSIGVRIRLGTPREIELLVDGRTEAYERETGHGAAVRVLAGELPTDPALPLSVRVELPDSAEGVPICTVDAEGERRTMVPGR